MSETNRQLFNAEVARLRAAYGVQIFSKKERWVLLWKVLDSITALFSSKKDPLSSRATTAVGPYIFFSSKWDQEHIKLSDILKLKHEEVHIQWCLALGLGHIWIGTILFLLLYALCPLPLGLAYFRYAAERAAYVVMYKEAEKLGIFIEIERIVEALSGAFYLWAWPFKKSVRRYLINHCGLRKGQAIK